MSWKNRPVFITGVSGFAGSYLAKRLVELGARVHGFVAFRADRTFPKNLSDRGLSSELCLHEGDIRDLYTLLSALEKAKPEVVFHLAAQSFVARSFSLPEETYEINCLGTSNLLEACRMKAPNARVVFAGSSEEYGLVVTDEAQLARYTEKHKLWPPPGRIPELPIAETNPLRPMSPYATAKVYGDHLFRQYYHTYNLQTVVSRGFNHEGAGRGTHFVTSVVAMGVAKFASGESGGITIGNVNAFRDWSHVSDMTEGYLLLADRAAPGAVYNQGSGRTNSVLTFLLMTLEAADMPVSALKTIKGGVEIESPGKMETSEMFGLSFPVSRVDRMTLNDGLQFTLEHEGLLLATPKGDVTLRFNPDRFRPSEVPILLCDNRSSVALGARYETPLSEVASDMFNFYASPKNRTAFVD